MPRVYVVGGYRPNGGAFMAYHLARILHLDFGFEGWAVRVDDESPDASVFEYQPVFPSITVEELPSVVRDEDILIANPSFSRLALGFTVNCWKVMYIQGFNTFDVLDLKFDLYVSVSNFVSQFVFNTYGIETRVIPPFISAAEFPAPLPWSARPTGSILVLNDKGDRRRQAAVLGRIQAHLRRHRPDIRLDDVVHGKARHRDFVARLGRTRHLLSLSPAEGFGLVPLEAMAMGTTVIGFDAFGGRDYMRPAVNCAAVPWPEVEDLAHWLTALIDHPQQAESLAREGSLTARRPEFTYDHFRALWADQFTRFLG